MTNLNETYKEIIIEERGDNDIRKMLKIKFQKYWDSHKLNYDNLTSEHMIDLMKIGYDVGLKEGFTRGFRNGYGG